MVYVLGIACVGWTLYELVRIWRETDSWTRRSATTPRAAGFARARRSPLAAWDEQGRPIFVEDVSHRGPR